MHCFLVFFLRGKKRYLIMMSQGSRLNDHHPSQGMVLNDDEPTMFQTVVSSGLEWRGEVTRGIGTFFAYPGYQDIVQYCGYLYSQGSPQNGIVVIVYSAFLVPDYK